MKKTRRVLTCLLAVLMLVSGMVLSSFAEESGVVGEVSEPEYRDVLKFYDPLYSRLYDDESFEDGEYGGSIIIMDSARPYTTEEIRGTDNKYLAMKLGHILNPDARTNAAYAVDFGGEALSRVVIRASVSATHSERSGKVCNSCRFTTDDLAASHCPICCTELATVSSKAPTVFVAVSEGVDGTGAPLIAFDFDAGSVAYYDGASTRYVDGLAVSEGSWYSVEVVYDATQYSFKINDGENEYSVTAVNSPAHAIKNINVGARYVNDARECTIMLDNIFVQAGVDDRNTGVDLYAETNEGLALLDSMLRDDAVSVEVKNDVVAVYDALTGIYADNLAIDTVGEELLSSVRGAMVDFFVEQLKIATDTINVDGTYTARLTLIEDNAVYAERITAMMEDASSATASELLLTYNTEKLALQQLAANSDRFIEYIEGLAVDDPFLFATHNYETLKGFVEETDSIFKDADGNVIYSPSYPAIKESLATYTVVENRYYSNVEKSALFCENVAKAKLAEDDLKRAEDERQLTDSEFVESFAAYSAAKAGVFSDASYPGVDEALADYAAFEQLGNISVVADRFIANVETAKQALYIFMKEQWLDAAESDYAVVDSRYPNVEKAKKDYDDLRVEIADKKAAAAAYIAAVAALEGKTGAELITAVEAALALKDAGDVQGYPGVTEANIALDNIHKSQQLGVAYAEKFITLAGNIKDAETLNERFTAITLASEARGFASDSVEGVAAANAELIAAISLYEADIAAINASYESVVSNAAGLAAAATSATDIIKIVASVIKAIQQ